MSWLSSVTGIGINPFGKTKVKIDPLKALGTGLTVASMGGLSGVGAALGSIPGVSAAANAARAIPGIGALGSVAGKVGSIASHVPGASTVGNTLLNGFGGAGAIGARAGAGAVGAANGGGAAPPAPAGAPGGSPATNESWPSAMGGMAGAAAISGLPGTQPTAPTQAGGNIWSNIGNVLKTPGVIPAIGDVAGGVLQGQSEAAQLKEKQNEFNRTQGLTENQSALQAEHAASTAPLRDRAIFMLQQRMGVPQQQFQPHDIYNQSYGSGPAQLGGITPGWQNALNQANQSYRPGAGGVNQALYQAFLKRYGGQSA